eukprot:3086517-Pyramimonas_sp.AAC.1
MAQSKASHGAHGQREGGAHGRHHMGRALTITNVRALCNCVFRDRASAAHRAAAGARGNYCPFGQRPPRGQYHRAEKSGALRSP